MQLSSDKKDNAKLKCIKYPQLFSNAEAAIQLQMHSLHASLVFHGLLFQFRKYPGADCVEV